MTRPRALRLAVLATLRIVLELFIVEKQLLSGSEYKLVAAIHALQNSIEELHRDTLTFAPRRMHYTRVGSYTATSLTSRKNGALPLKRGNLGYAGGGCRPQQEKRIERADPKEVGTAGQPVRTGTAKVN